MPGVVALLQDVQVGFLAGLGDIIPNRNPFPSSSFGHLQAAVHPILKTSPPIRSLGAVGAEHWLECAVEAAPRNRKGITSFQGAALKDTGRKAGRQIGIMLPDGLTPLQLAAAQAIAGGVLTPEQEADAALGMPTQVARSEDKMDSVMMAAEAEMQKEADNDADDSSYGNSLQESEVAQMTQGTLSEVEMQGAGV